MPQSERRSSEEQEFNELTQLSVSPRSVISVELISFLLLFLCVFLLLISKERKKKTFKIDETFSLQAIQTVPAFLSTKLYELYIQSCLI